MSKTERSVTLSESALVEHLAKAMAYKSVGDPNALDIRGEPRWKWYTDEAEKYVGTYGYLLFPKPPTSASQ